MKLIFAQGNPGQEYEQTRHNVGFRVLDSYAQKHGIEFQARDKFKALIAELSVDGEKVLLAKPQTFYNETGQSARAIVDFYKLDPTSDILVIHDELALPFGTIRIRGQGSDAGNNGIKSLNTHLGTSYHRLRVGIASDSLTQMGATDFVLAKLTTEETVAFPDIIAKTTQAIDDFLAGQLEHTTL